MTAKQFVILDYGLGNIRSVANALHKLNLKSIVSSNILDINDSCAMIIPGVGAFRHGMENLERIKLIEPILKFVSSGRLVLGICLGMQMMMETSEEFGKTDGLKLIKGNVQKIDLTLSDQHRLPHIGWNSISPGKKEKWDNTILCDIDQNDRVYFLHSYAVSPDNEDHILALTKYGDCEFVASIQSENVLGCQFHPEKSGEIGLKILKNFTNMAINN